MIAQDAPARDGAPPRSAPPERRWAARLDLRFSPGPDRTVLGGMAFHGPLRVQRPFYPEGGPCHVYILHPPGGLVSGDALQIEARVEPGAHAVLTTPSAGKVYGADRGNGAQSQAVSLKAEGGLLEWLPLETIVFDRANAVLSTRVDLSGGARVLAWDILCLGRPAGDHPFLSGSVEQRLDVRRDGQPLLLERQMFEGGGEVMSEPFGLAGAPVCGTMVAAGMDAVPDDVMEFLQRELRSAGDAVCAVTHRRGVLAVRYRGYSAEEARTLFTRAWSRIRPALAGREACPPRIWST